MINLLVNRGNDPVLEVGRYALMISSDYIATITERERLCCIPDNCEVRHGTSELDQPDIKRLSNETVLRGF